MPATSIFIKAASCGTSGMGNSRISVLLGPVLTAASTLSTTEKTSTNEGLERVSLRSSQQVHLSPSQVGLARLAHYTAQPGQARVAWRGRNGRLAPIPGEGATTRKADPPHPDRASAIRPLPSGGLCVLGRLALVCRKALFLRREWPRIEPRTVFSTMFDHLRADSSLHRRCNGDCAPQIVAAAGKNDLHAVAHKRVKPHSAQPIMLLKNRERSLDCCSDAADHSIATLLSWRQFGMMFVGPAHQAVLDSGLSKTRMPRMGVIGLIAIDRFLVSADEIIVQFRIRDGGIREISPADHRVVSVDANVNLVAEDGFVALAAPSCIRIRAGLCRGLSRFSARLARRLRPSGHQRGINQRAMLEDHVFGFELTIDLGKYPIHQTVSRKLLPETPQRAVIGSAIMQAQPCKAAKRDAIGNRHLQRRVGQAMPDAEQQAPQQYFCRIAGITRASLAALTKQRSHRCPIQDCSKLIQHAAGRWRHQTVRQAQLSHQSLNHLQSFRINFSK